jgi:uncharacterized protein YgiM (DUF1202 family)
MGRKVTRKPLSSLLSALLALGATAAAPGAVHAQDTGQNLLQNPAFDWPVSARQDVCAPGWVKDNAIVPWGWEAYWTCKNGEERNQDQINRPPEFRMMTVDIPGSRVRSYPTAGSFFNYWSLNRSAGFFQIVNDMKPGTRLRFSFWANLLTTNSDELPLSSWREPGGLQARACIHTTGNVVLAPNMNDPALTCGAWIRPYETWGEAWVEATAGSDRVAVIIDTSADYPVKHNDVNVDDAALVVAGQGAATAPAAGAPAQQPQTASAPAANDGVPRVTIKTETGNVRAAPSTSASILASLPQGTAFPIKAYTVDKQWWQIQYSGGQGGVAYIHDSVVTLNSAAQAALGVASAPASAPAAAPATQPTTQATVVVNTGGDRLNVRATPDPAGRVLGKAQNGASLTVKGISPDKKWWRIAFAGSADGTAWVMAQFVTPNAAAQTLAAGS